MHRKPTIFQDLRCPIFALFLNWMDVWLYFVTMFLDHLQKELGFSYLGHFLYTCCTRCSPYINSLADQTFSSNFKNRKKTMKLLYGGAEFEKSHQINTQKSVAYHFLKNRKIKHLHYTFRNNLKKVRDLEKLPCWVNAPNHYL